VKACRSASGCSIRRAASRTSLSTHIPSLRRMSWRGGCGTAVASQSWHYGIARSARNRVLLRTWPWARRACATPAQAACRTPNHPHVHGLGSTVGWEREPFHALRRSSVERVVFSLSAAASAVAPATPTQLSATREAYAIVCAHRRAWHVLRQHAACPITRMCMGVAVPRGERQCRCTHIRGPAW